MNRFWILLAFMGLAAVPACNSSHQEGEHQEENAQKGEVSANAVADLYISGMVCEMNCVGTVNKTLMKMEGVASFEMEDFDGEKDINHAIVQFDKNIVSEQEMISAIEELNDGIYKVESSEVKDLEVTNGSSASQANETEDTRDSASYGSGGQFSLPNIFDLFSNTL